MAEIKLRFPGTELPIPSLAGIPADVRSGAYVEQDRIASSTLAPAIREAIDIDPSIEPIGLTDTQPPSRPDRATPRILSRRGCLQGRSADAENTLATLKSAISRGFDVAFDIQQTPEHDGLVLSQEPMAWSPERNVVSFLTTATAHHCHALRIQHLDTLPVIEKMLERARARDRFFLSHFEQVSDDSEACRALMRAAAERGFQVAYRISEREPYLEAYSRDSGIEKVWLDEVEGPWITRDHIHRLNESGIESYYASPELHSQQEPKSLPARWEQLASWGVSAICTDYPLQLQRFLGAGSDDKTAVDLPSSLARKVA